MTSPFVDTSKYLASKLATLDNIKRAELFTAASRALLPAYKAWSKAEGVAPELTLHDAVYSCIRDYFRNTQKSDSAKLLAAVAEIEFEDPHTTDWFLAAQDCWILLTQAMQCLVENDNGSQGTWFLLEPMFQATCKRLFGFTEADSDEEETTEAKALNDPRLHDAIASIEKAIDDLASDNANLGSIDLAPLNPMN